MKIPFSKLHGAGNDFLITAAADVPVTNPEELAIAICHRHTGVGADGWIILDRIAGPGYDATIRLFNSDGSEPEISGNGTRCVALLMARQGADPPIRIRTAAGIKELRPQREISDYAVEFEMDMGRIAVVDEHADVHGFDAVILDVGNPQCAIPVDDFEFDWRSAGAAIEHDPRFPKRTNVSFIRKKDRHAIDVRFWERGAGETNSSGTGSTGAALAAVVRGIAESPVTVVTPAGPLHVRLQADTARLTGPAQFIADGHFHYVCG
jgi:diaminopimelate epimerase